MDFRLRGDKYLHEDCTISEPFRWDDQRSQAAIALALGKTKDEVASEVGCVRKTVYNWLAHPDFAAEVDRLSLMVGIASKAERLRIAQRVIRQKTKDGTVDTEKDVLEWLKFAKDEQTNLSILGLAAQLSDTESKPTAEPAIPPPLAGSGSTGSEEESVN